MKDWQFAVLFWAGVGGALFLLVAPAIPALKDIPKNPGAITGVGTILAYVLTQRRNNKRDDDPPHQIDKKPEEKVEE